MNENSNVSTIQTEALNDNFKYKVQPVECLSVLNVAFNVC